MNRRGFFQSVLGFVGGVVACFHDKPKLIYDEEKHPRRVGYFAPDGGIEKRRGTKYMCASRCNCPDQRIVEFQDRFIVACPNHAPYWINPDGSQEDVEFIEYPRYYLYATATGTYTCSGNCYSRLITHGYEPEIDTFTFGELV